MALCWSLSCTGEPRTGTSTPGVASPDLRREERKDHLSLFVGNTSPNAAQDTIHFLCPKCTLLGYDQLGVHQDPQVLFCQWIALSMYLWTGASDCSYPSVGLCTSCWTLWHIFQLISPACCALSGHQHNPLVYQPPLPVCHQQTCCRCTLPHHPGKPCAESVQWHRLGGLRSSRHTQRTLF